VSLSEDFARWRDDPMTRMVIRALKAAEEAQKRQWDAFSWGGDMVRADQLADTLKELRVRADCYRSLHDMTADDVAAWLGME
jgi:hypothetical protein